MKRHIDTDFNSLFLFFFKKKKTYSKIYISKSHILDSHYSYTLEGTFCSIHLKETKSTLMIMNSHDANMSLILHIHPNKFDSLYHTTQIC